MARRRRARRVIINNAGIIVQGTARNPTITRRKCRGKNNNCCGRNRCCCINANCNAVNSMLFV